MQFVHINAALSGNLVASQRAPLYSVPLSRAVILVPIVSPIEPKKPVASLTTRAAGTNRRPLFAFATCCKFDYPFCASPSLFLKQFPDPTGIHLVMKMILLEHGGLEQKSFWKPLPHWAGAERWCIGIEILAAVISIGYALSNMLYFVRDFIPMVSQ